MKKIVLTLGVMLSTLTSLNAATDTSSVTINTSVAEYNRLAIGLGLPTNQSGIIMSDFSQDIGAKFWSNIENTMFLASSIYSTSNNTKAISLSASAAICTHTNTDTFPMVVEIDEGGYQVLANGNTTNATVEIHSGTVTNNTAISSIRFSGGDNGGVALEGGDITCTTTLTSTVN